MNNSYMKYQHIYQEMENNPQLLESLENGSMPILHIDNHQFRDRIKSAELGKKGNIYLQHYLPAGLRAGQTQQQFQSGHLKEDTFDPNLPHKNHSFWLKVRQIPKEGPSISQDSSDVFMNDKLQEIFGPNKRTENERIIDYTTKGDGYLIDHTKKDTKMIHYPDWKPIQKQNWVANKNIDTTTCLYQGPKSNPPWEQLPLRHNHEGAEYIDGLDKVGENIHRFRDKKKEHNRPDFISSVSKDAIGQTLHISQSLRAFKSHKILGVKPDTQEFSKTHKLSFYKQPLIETKSVDHQVPYMHSQSIRSQPVRDLMPTTEKVYKLSVKQFIIDSNKHKLNQSHQQFQEKSEQFIPFSPSARDTITTPNVPKQQSQFKEQVKQNDQQQLQYLSGSNPVIQKNSRGSQRTTQYSWNKSRAQTAATNKRKSLNDLGNLKSKLNSDPYYQPTLTETKNLVSKYFFV